MHINKKPLKRIVITKKTNNVEKLFDDFNTNLDPAVLDNASFDDEKIEVELVEEKETEKPKSKKKSSKKDNND